MAEEIAESESLSHEISDNLRQIDDQQQSVSRDSPETIKSKFGITSDALKLKTQDLVDQTKNLVKSLTDKGSKLATELSGRTRPTDYDSQQKEITLVNNLDPSIKDTVTTNVNKKSSSLFQKFKKFRDTFGDETIDSMRDIISNRTSAKISSYQTVTTSFLGGVVGCAILTDIFLSFIGLNKSPTLQDLKFSAGVYLFDLTTGTSKIQTTCSKQGNFSFPTNQPNDPCFGCTGDNDCCGTANGTCGDGTLSPKCCFCNKYNLPCKESTQLVQSCYPNGIRPDGMIYVALCGDIVTMYSYLIVLDSVLDDISQEKKVNLIYTIISGVSIILFFIILVGYFVYLIKQRKTNKT